MVSAVRILCKSLINKLGAPADSSLKKRRERTYYSGKRVVEGMTEGEADFEPLDVGEVAGNAAEHGWGDARTRKVE